MVAPFRAGEHPSIGEQSADDLPTVHTSILHTVCMLSRSARANSSAPAQFHGVPFARDNPLGAHSAITNHFQGLKDWGVHSKVCLVPRLVGNLRLRKPTRMGSDSVRRSRSLLLRRCCVVVRSLRRFLRSRRMTARMRRASRWMLIRLCEALWVLKRSWLASIRLSCADMESSLG